MYIYGEVCISTRGLMFKGCIFQGVYISGGYISGGVYFREGCIFQGGAHIYGEVFISARGECMLQGGVCLSEKCTMV